MKVLIPTVSEVQQLTELLSLTIPAEWEDYNGHVNIQFYMKMYESGGWPMMESMGLSESYFESLRFGFFDFEHHVRYLSEIHINDNVKVYARLIDVSAKRFHGMMFIVNQSRQQLASTLEYVSGGVNLSLRKTAPFPDNIMLGLQKKLNEHIALDWSPPICKIMSI